MDESNLYQYQKASAEHIIKNTHCGLFLEMGLGKTVSTLTAINRLMFEELEVRRVLVIAPKRVVESVWNEECLKWDHLSHFKVVKVIGSEKQRKQAIAKRGDIFLISRDNVAWLCGLFGGHTIPFDMLVIDELSSFKNPKSVRFKALKGVQPCFNRVVGLTGTPAPNGLEDIWSQVYLLDRGERLGKFITHFRDDYFKPGKRNGSIVYKYKAVEGAKESIYDKIGDICMSMSAEDYLDLPEKIINEVVVDFPESLKEKYVEFERENILELFSDYEDGQTISAVNAAALSIKLLQFANGAVYDENKGVHEVHSLKIDAVKEIVEESPGQPILIAWTFKSDRDRLEQALKKYKPRRLQNNQDVDDWNAGKINILLMHPASGGHGLNLQYGGNTIIWFGQTWSLELYEQFNARLHRQNQKNTVIIHKIIARGTIDDQVVKAIELKAAGQKGLMEAVKARIEKYLNV